MSRICPLYSGSTGNCTYIGTKAGGILVDAGASLKGITEKLLTVGAEIDEIKAVARTHCNDDHIKGLWAVLKKTNAKLICSEKTAHILEEKNVLLPETEILINEREISLYDTEISAFSTSHDVEGSLGYSFILPDGKKFSTCTDTGVITEEISHAIAGSDLILLESNHDIDMLKRGPYPPYLKVRIMSDKGHISNAVCAEEVKKLYKSGTMRFILGHLSLNNNTPLLAQSTSESALMDLSAKNGKDYILNVAKPKGNGVIVI